MLCVLFELCTAHLAFRNDQFGPRAVSVLGSYLRHFTGFLLKKGVTSLWKTRDLPENVKTSARNGNLLVTENKMTDFSARPQSNCDCCPCHVRFSDRL